MELYVADWSPIYPFLYERDVTDQFSLADAVKGIVHIHDQDPVLVYCFTVLSCNVFMYFLRYFIFNCTILVEFFPLLFICRLCGVVIRVVFLPCLPVRPKIAHGNSQNAYGNE